MSSNRVSKRIVGISCEKKIRFLLAVKCCVTYSFYYSSKHELDRLHVYSFSLPLEISYLAKRFRKRLTIRRHR
jgi:hypothetical protein